MINAALHISFDYDFCFLNPPLDCMLTFTKSFIVEKNLKWIPNKNHHQDNMQVKFIDKLAAAAHVKDLMMLYQLYFKAQVFHLPQCGLFVFKKS